MFIWDWLVGFWTGPAQVWHLLVFVLAPLAIAEATMRERIADVERGVETILDRIDPDDD